MTQVVQDAFRRHSKVALQFSGGKDSLAILYLLRDYWQNLTVYFCESGAALPETLELVERVKAEVPHFVTVQGRQPTTIQDYGFPSDLVPCVSTLFGRRLAGDTGVPMNDRYTCCALSIMAPLHERMQADGITLIIRGQRNSDAQKSPVRSGMTVEGFEFLLPIEDWTDDQVFDFLAAEKVEIPRFYRAGMSSAPDCINCTAWLEHGLPAYLKQFYPDEAALQALRLEKQADEITPVYKTITTAIGRV